MHEREEIQYKDEDLPPTGLELIIKERERQITEEGWSAEHDDIEQAPGDLAAAARAYTLYAWWQLSKTAGWTKKQILDIILEQEWPWDVKWWKPSEDPIRNLQKAGALLAAEIDRQQRQKAKV